MAPEEWFALRVVGTIAGPFALMTAFLTFVPGVLAGFPWTVNLLCLAVGLVASRPQQITANAIGVRALYSLIVLAVLQFWIVFTAPPSAWRVLNINF